MTKQEVSQQVHDMRRGTQALFFTQIFSTLSYCVLYSTLVLYGTEKLKLSASVMTTLMGSYVAFNYGLHFLGGYMSGRFTSNRSLFVIGVACQVVACFIIAQTTFASLMLGLSIFLTGSGLNVTCMNNMVTQLFDDPKDPRREKAFLWNYSGMNIGFFLGYAIAGYYELSKGYSALFTFGGCASSIAIILIILNWKRLKDKDTYLTEMPKEKQKIQFIKGLAIIFIVFLALIVLLRHAELSNVLIAVIGVALVILTVFIGALRKNPDERNKMLVFVVFLIAAFVFWSLYQLAPMGLVLFIAHNVNLHMFGFEIAPQWVNNINTVVIVIGGPIMGWGLVKLREKGYKISIPFLFSIALIQIGIGFVILPIGVHLAAANGIVSFNWIFWSYIFQSTGELCISPIGYAMIGELIPKKLQGMMMGLNCMMSGLGGIASNYLSIYAVGAENTDLNPLVTNPGYANMFGHIGYIALAVGIVMLIFTPLLYRIMEKHSNSAQTA